MPVLLRRALSQLRGDPPESWPRTDHAPQYPFPTLDRFNPHLRARTARADLLGILARLDRAELGSAWERLSDRCKATNRDPGEIVLSALTDALLPASMTNAATRAANVKRVTAAARKLTEAIEVLRDTGVDCTALMPPDPTALPGIAPLAHELDFMAGVAARKPRMVRVGSLAQRAVNPRVPSDVVHHVLQRHEVLLDLLRHVSKLAVGKVRQTRGTQPQRIALAIARRLAPVAGTTTAVVIANAATNARISSKALAKKRN